MRTTHPLTFAVAFVATLAACDDRPLPISPSAITPSLGTYIVLVGGPVTLSPLTGSTYGWAGGINGAGDIVGASTSTALPVEDNRVAVVWKSGTTTPELIEPINSEAWDINDVGQVVGWRGAGGSHAILWSPDGSGYSVTDIGALLAVQFDATSSIAFGINAFGQVVGNYHSTSTTPTGRCFLWTPSGPNATQTASLVDLGTLGRGCVANDINSVGVVTGRSHVENPGGSDIPHAFVWTPVANNAPVGAMSDVTPGQQSTANAINDAPQAAGSYTPALTRPAIFEPAGSSSWTVIDLGLPAFASLGNPASAAAADINDAGHVVGVARNSTGSRGFFSLGDGSFVELPAPADEAVFVNAMTNSAFSKVIVVGATQAGSNVFTAVRWEVTVQSIELEEEVDFLADLVQDYHTRGVLTLGEARSLLGKLDGAARQSAKQPLAAVNILGAFVNEVTGLVAARRVTTELAQPLFEHARLAIAALQGGPA